MSLEPIRQTIEQLEALDLSQYPHDEIAGLLRNFGRVAVIRYQLHQGKTILRARPENDQWPYLTRASHSYKPQEYNKTYQRASTPYQTMFYGSIIPEDLEENELDNERIVVSMEASPWLRCKTTCGVRRIAYSKWLVTEDITMVAVLQHKDFFDASSHTRKIVGDFQSFLKEHPEDAEASIMVSDHIARQFAKEQTKHDYDYLISAVYSNYIVDKGFDGVLFPSVRVGGEGFNVALSPECVDQKLKLLGVGECTMYKRTYGDVQIDNDTVAEVIDDQEPFVYLPVEPQYHSGPEIILADLGVVSVEELCTKPGYLLQ